MYFGTISLPPGDPKTVYRLSNKTTAHPKYENEKLLNDIAVIHISPINQDLIDDGIN